MNTGLTFFLRWLDKSSSNITVLIESKRKRNPGCFGISLRCRKSGFRNTCYDICIYRIRFCKRFTATDSGIIYLYSVNGAVKSCKIYVLKYAMRTFCSSSSKFFIGLQSVFCDRKDLSRLNVTNKFCTYRCQRAALRSDNISISSLTEA